MTIYLYPERNFFLSIHLTSISSKPTWLLWHIFITSWLFHIIFCLLKCVTLTLRVTFSIQNLIWRCFNLFLYSIRWYYTRFVQFKAILSITAIKLLQMNIRLYQNGFIVDAILVISHIFNLAWGYIGDLKRCKFYFFAWSIVNCAILTLIWGQCTLMPNGWAAARSLDYLIIIWILMRGKGRGPNCWQHTPCIVETWACPVVLRWIILAIFCCQVNIKDSHVQNFPVMIHRFLQVFWIVWNLSFIQGLLLSSILT